MVVTILALVFASAIGTSGLVGITGVAGPVGGADAADVPVARGALLVVLVLVVLMLVVCAAGMAMIAGGCCRRFQEHSLLLDQLREVLRRPYIDPSTEFSKSVSRGTHYIMRRLSIVAAAGRASMGTRTRQYAAQNDRLPAGF